MQTEENPGVQTGALEISGRDNLESTALTPSWVFDPDERQFHELEAKVREAGFRLAVRCRVCGSWLVADRSRTEHIGPVCRGRVSVDA
ncbi:DUF6011 domain-containing protein [Gordonia sp. MP11Mi]|uniref:Uncharacterized protein n=1 Tax=Gordonia sp. MP11Mi TaxID=3022769 RepID=A0AA97GVG9_9ACTN